MSSKLILGRFIIKLKRFLFGERYCITWWYRREAMDDKKIAVVKVYANSEVEAKLIGYEKIKHVLRRYSQLRLYNTTTLIRGTHDKRKEINHYPKSNLGGSVAQVNGKIYINGYRCHPETQTFTFHLWYWLKHIFS